MDQDDCSIFISHAAVDQEIATALKLYIGKALPAHGIFVSSDPDDLKLGDQWIPKILGALKTTSFVIVLATSRGLSRKWVWFEAGRTWFSGVKMLPCCVGTLRKSGLPAPFSEIMGANLDEALDVEALFGELERSFGKLSSLTDYAELARTMARLDVRVEERMKILDDPFSGERMKEIESQMAKLSKAERETIRQFVLYGTLSTSGARTRVRETGADMERWSVPEALAERTGWLVSSPGNSQFDNLQKNQFSINLIFKPFLEEYLRRPT